MKPDHTSTPVARWTALSATAITAGPGGTTEPCGAIDLLSGRPPDNDVDVGSNLLSVAADGTRMYTLTTQGLQRRNMETAAVEASVNLAEVVTFATSNRSVIVATTDGTLIAFDADSLAPRHNPLPATSGAVAHLVLDPGAHHLLTADSDGTVRVYDLDKPLQLGTDIAGKLGGGIAIDPDGSEIATSTNGAINVWTLDATELEAAACELAGRNLDSVEWSAYIGALARPRPTCY